MTQKRIQKPRTLVRKNTRTEVMDQKPTKSEQKRSAIRAELDTVLDDIDAVLEENAELFVDQYVQQGGQ